MELGEVLTKYLECSKEDIQYYMISNLPGQTKEINQPREAHPRDALILENDTFWHYGMGINLYVENNKNPANTFIFNLALKEEKTILPSDSQDHRKNLRLILINQKTSNQ